MSDLEAAVRAAVTQLTRRYRVIPVAQSDDEAVTAILAACRAETDRAIKSERAEFGKAVATRASAARTTTAAAARRATARRQP